MLGYPNMLTGRHAAPAWAPARLQHNEGVWMISKRRRAPLRALGPDVMRADAAAARAHNTALRDGHGSSPAGAS